MLFQRTSCLFLGVCDFGFPTMHNHISNWFFPMRLESIWDEAACDNMAKGVWSSGPSSHLWQRFCFHCNDFLVVLFCGFPLDSAARVTYILHYSKHCRLLGRIKQGEPHVRGFHSDLSPNCGTCVPSNCNANSQFAEEIKGMQSFSLEQECRSLSFWFILPLHMLRKGTDRAVLQEYCISNFLIEYCRGIPSLGLPTW